MTMMLETEPTKLPLHDEHLRKGARMGDFGGWLVPLFYTSIMEEHAAVRNKAGVFDISHMGQCLITGDDAAARLERLTPSDIAGLKFGAQKYSRSHNHCRQR